MDPIVIGAIISGVVALGTAIAGTVASKEQSDSNISAQKEFNSSQSLSAKISEAKENGISPLAVLGQNASNAVVSAPQSNADYTGFSGFGNSLMSSMTSAMSSKYSTDKRTATDKEIQSMKNKNAEEITNLNISADEKKYLAEINASLAIEERKISSNETIQNSINIAQHNLEMLKSSNAEFVQNKQLKNSMDMLEKQLEEARKERNAKMQRLLVQEAFETFQTSLQTAGYVVGSAIR